MDGLDAMLLCDANVAGMESVGGKDQGGERLNFDVYVLSRRKYIHYMDAYRCAQMNVNKGI